MKQLIIVLISTMFSLLSYSQKQIELSSVANHVGDTVLVKGKVYSARYLANSTGSPTLLNVGAAYPNQLLTLVIWGEDRKNFSSIPEDLYGGEQIVISGKVELFRSKPQIIIHSPKQIQVSKSENTK